MMGRHMGVCACCGQEGTLAGRGLCRACYSRAYKAGTLDHWPKTVRPGSAPVIECVCCGQRGSDKGRGLRSACWDRHEAAGTLEQWPVRTGDATARRAAFKALREGGLSVPEAAARLGVSRKTAEQYQTLLVKRGWTPPGPRRRRRLSGLADRELALRVAGYAHDAADLRMLLESLGLFSEQAAVAS
jgi:hypothetical protein